MPTITTRVAQVLGRGLTASEISKVKDMEAKGITGAYTCADLLKEW